MNIKTFAKKTDIDYEKVMEDFCGDTAALKKAIETFADRQAFDSLLKAIEEKDEESVKALSHRLRKEAERLSLSECSKLCRKLEESPSDKYRGFLSPLSKEFDSIISALED